uniref:inorganic diphosphatase n=1 Tax=Petromyzon marinus TaxID=7757 RepID=A0AAJ7X8G0_PETMA|nr:inorganic pyrophosphatase-like [Petromyzon marinus]
MWWKPLAVLTARTPARGLALAGMKRGPHRGLAPLAASRAYGTEERGEPNSPEYRLFYRNAQGQLISPFHDIPLYADAKQKLYNMVVEIPRWSNAKMEIATKLPLNPIKQDVKKGKLRFTANVFPYKGYIWNYGAIPQTWEDPSHKDADTGCCGDNDPVDVCDIGLRVCNRGEVVSVKALGVLALIDEGETDWKVIVINADDPEFNNINSLADVERLRPGYLDATRNWFRVYKIPEGKPENCFAFDGKFKDKEFAEEVLQSTHRYWRSLITGATSPGQLDCTNTSVDGSPFKRDQKTAQAALQANPPLGAPKSIPVEVDKWHYLSR